MIQQELVRQSSLVTTIWKPLNSYEGINPIWQVYGVCFTRNREVVIIRDHLQNGYFTPWHIPGGTPKEGESPEQTLHRGVNEQADISISNLKLLGALEVFFPNNPNIEKGDHYYQLRYFALIEEIREQYVDPHYKKMGVRKLIPAVNFTEYVEWGDIGAEIIRAALIEFDKILPHAN
ncbi:MAG: NUDIX domain-containing protein [Patescibacteria group bacterium]|jgi:ADP-ribose pyrophosphatase YjhB (NUDIX family)